MLFFPGAETFLETRSVGAATTTNGSALLDSAVSSSSAASGLTAATASSPSALTAAIAASAYNRKHLSVKYQKQNCCFSLDSLGLPQNTLPVKTTQPLRICPSEFLPFQYSFLKQLSFPSLIGFYDNSPAFCWTVLWYFLISTCLIAHLFKKLSNHVKMSKYPIHCTCF